MLKSFQWTANSLEPNTNDMTKWLYLSRSACCWEQLVLLNCASWIISMQAPGHLILQQAAISTFYYTEFLLPSSKLCQPPLLTESVSSLGHVSIKLCTAASPVTNCILYFYWAMSKALAYHLMLYLDKLSIRQLLPDQLVAKKENITRQPFNNYYFLR